VDEGGSVRAALFLEDGAPVFQLADARGEARLRLFDAQDATGMTIMDGQGTTRIGVAQFSHGGGGVALHGPDSRGAVVLYLKEQGSLRIFDEDGAVTFQLPQAR